MKTILSSKGQLVIPKTLREEFGLSEGDRVALVSRTQLSHLSGDTWIGLTALCGSIMD